MIELEEFGAIGDGVTLNDLAFEDAINALPPGGGRIGINAGHYRISKPIPARSALGLIGDGAYSTVIEQAAPGVPGITGVDIHNLDIVDLGLTGPGASAGPAPGISLTRSAAANTPYICVAGVAVQNFGGDGIAISNAIVSQFNQVRVLTNGGNGINLYGVPNGAAGTSCHLSACYAVGNAGSGYVLNKMAYSKLDACASDKNAVGYLVADCMSISLAACGAEATLPPSKAYSGNGVLINASSYITVEGFFSYEASAALVSLINGSSKVRAYNLVSVSPLVAAPLMQLDATSSFD